MLKTNEKKSISVRNRKPMKKINTLSKKNKGYKNGNFRKIYNNWNIKTTGWALQQYGLDRGQNQ